MSPETLRVCILTTLFPPDFAGHGLQLERMLPHLRAQGIEPTIIALRPHPGVDWPADEEVPVLRILAPGTRPWHRLQRIARVRAHLRRHHGEYDVLHSANGDYEFLLNVAYAKRLGLPLVYEMVLLGEDDPLTVARSRSGPLRMRILSRVDAWVAITDAFRPSVREAGVPEERYRTIRTSVDVDRYRPAREAERRETRARLEIPEEARVLVSAGSLMERKGMDRVLRAWEQTAPVKGRDLLLIAGPASVAEGLRPHELAHASMLRAMAETPQLAGTVRFLGRVDDLERIVAASDVFVFLSRKEGLGNVTIEAMACGLPSIVSPLDGIGHELLDEGRTGFVAEAPDDAGAVAARITELFEDPERRRAIGAAARESAVERFSMKQRAEALATLYRGLAAGPSTPGGSTPGSA